MTIAAREVRSAGPQTTPATRRNPPRRPDPTPWPTSTGYVSVEQMMHALGGASVSTIYNYKRMGLIPEPEHVGLNRVAWPVEVARRALADLPAKVAAQRMARRP